MFHVAGDVMTYNIFTQAPMANDILEFIRVGLGHIESSCRQLRHEPWVSLVTVS